MLVNQNFKQIEIKKTGFLCVDCGRPTRLDKNDELRKNIRKTDNALLCNKCYERTENASEEELNVMKQKKQSKINKKTENFKNPDFIKQLCQIDEYMAENVVCFDPDDLESKVRD